MKSCLQWSQFYCPSWGDVALLFVHVYVGVSVHKLSGKILKKKNIYSLNCYLFLHDIQYYWVFLLTNQILCICKISLLLCSVTQQTAFCKILFFFFFHIINDNVMGLLQHYKTDDYQTCFDHHIFLLTLIRTKRKVHSNTNYKQAGQIHRPFHGHYSFKIFIKYKTLFCDYG